jgi:hypothetical protein
MVNLDQGTWAVLQAGDLLRELASLEFNPTAVEKARDEARRLLRHYPREIDVVLAAQALQGARDRTP